MGRPLPKVLRGLLFDLDGTLCHSDPVHFQAFRNLLLEHGRDLDEATYKRVVVGGSNAAIFAALFPDLDEAERVRLADRKEALFRSLADTLQPVAGLLEVLEWAASRALPMALVTNAPQANVQFMLAGLKLESRFPIQVVGDDLPRAKPDPLPYATGLARLGFQSDQVLAFEDSRPGVQAASGAGLFTVGLSTSHEPVTLLDAGADLVVPDFRDAALWRILEEAA